MRRERKRKRDTFIYIYKGESQVTSGKTTRRLRKKSTISRGKERDIFRKRTPTNTNLKKRPYAASKETTKNKT